MDSLLNALQAAGVSTEVIEKARATVEEQARIDEAERNAPPAVRASDFNPPVETAPTATPAATGRGKGAVPKDQALIGLTNEWLGGAAIRSNHAKIMGCERKGSITTHLKNLARDGKIEIRYLDESKGINGPCEYRLRQGE